MFKLIILDNDIYSNIQDVSFSWIANFTKMFDLIENYQFPDHRDTRYVRIWHYITHVYTIKGKPW